MRTLRRLLVAALVVAVVVPAYAKGKDKVPAGVKTGKSKIELPGITKDAPNGSYLYVSVPEKYDAKAWWPVLWVLHSSEPGKPEDYVDAWAETALVKTWIIASRNTPGYDNEESIEPLKAAIAQVKQTYHVDDRRVVLAGHNAGGQMAWRLATRAPELFAAIVSFGGEIPSADRAGMKVLVGKPVFLFRGAKDEWYTQAALERDKKVLEAYKIVPQVEVLANWSVDFPRASIGGIAKWVDEIWPPGTYRDRAAEARKALDAKDLVKAWDAIAEIGSDLKKHPYPAFEDRRAALENELLSDGRRIIGEAKKLLEGGQPLLALEAAEAAVKAMKGTGPVLEKEAGATLDGLKKDAVVKAAVRKKEAEATAATYMEKAEAAAFNGDLAKALDWYRRVVALGDTSRKADAEKKVAEIEPKVPAK